MAKANPEPCEPLRSTHVTVWDLPTRLFHWAIVALVALSWISVDNGWMKVHLWSGMTLLTLLVFRILWGFVGSTTARFSHFVQPPPRVIRYLWALNKTNKSLHAGHNPAGGWMVMALIAILCTQVMTGLFANDGVRFNAPLALLVSHDRSDQLTQLHATLFDLILLLVWLHLVAVFFYLLVKGENLIAPMLNGKKNSTTVPTELDLRFTSNYVALFWIVFAAGFAICIVWAGH